MQRKSILSTEIFCQEDETALVVILEGDIPNRPSLTCSDVHLTFDQKWTGERLGRPMANTIQCLVIPSSIKSIHEAAFESCGLRSVIFAPTSQLQLIGPRAFSGNILDPISIPPSVETIENCAFSFCQLPQVSFEGDSSLTKLGEKAFASNCITSIVIPARVKQIGDSCFERCSDLRTVLIQTDSQLVEIGTRAFGMCPLTSITLPPSLRVLDGALRGSDVPIIHCSSESNFVVLDRILYTRDMKVLVASNRFVTDVVIPPCVKEIRSGSFEGSNIASVVFSEDAQLVSLGSFAFSGSEIEKVAIPATVEVIGEGCFSYCNRLSRIPLCSSGNLRCLGDRAFQNSSLVHISIPSSVRSIGTSCFFGCRRLKMVSFDKESELVSIGDNAFMGASALRSIYIPSSVEKIGDSCFEGCRNLSCFDVGPNSALVHLGTTCLQRTKVKSIEIPPLVEVIPSGCFFGLEMLTTVSFSANSRLREIKSNAFAMTGIVSFQLPDSVERIGNRCFSRCNSLTSFSASENSRLYEMGCGVFHDDKRLKSVVIPQHVKVLPGKCFAGCSSLQEVEFSSSCSLTSISYRAFYEAQAMKEITIPRSVERIEDEAFAICEGLRSVVFEASLQINLIGYRSFTQFEYLTMDLRGALNPLTILPSAFRSRRTVVMMLPSVMDSIPEGCFKMLHASIVLPEQTKLTTIRKNAFRQATVEIHLPKTIDLIESGAFTGCVMEDFSGESNQFYSYDQGFMFDRRKLALLRAWNQLETITVPSNVEEICDECFAWGNRSLKNVFFEEDSHLKRIGKRAFAVLPLERIAIPKSVVHIGRACFTDCNITDFSIEAGNQRYFFDDGIIYDTERKACVMSVQKRKEFVIPSHVKVIDPECFCGSDPTSVIFAEKSQVVEFGEYAFGFSLQSISIPETVETISTRAFCVGTGDKLEINVASGNPNFSCRDGFLCRETHALFCLSFGSLSEIVIPSFVTVIEDKLFYLRSLWGKVTFQENSQLTRIGKWAFRGSHIESITIPASCQVIGSKCFEYVWSGFGLTILFDEGSQLMTIGKKAFYHAALATSIVIPKKVSQIGYCAFSGMSMCPILEMQHEHFDFESLGFCRLLCNVEKTRILGVLHTVPEVIIIPASIEIIEKYSFYMEDKLEIVTFSGDSKLKSIGKKAFYRTGVTNVSLPNRNVEIGYRAFNFCCRIEYMSTDVPEEA